MMHVQWENTFRSLIEFPSIDLFMLGVVILKIPNINVCLAYYVITVPRPSPAAPFFNYSTTHSSVKSAHTPRDTGKKLNCISRHFVVWPAASCVLGDRVWHSFSPILSVFVSFYLSLTAATPTPTEKATVITTDTVTAATTTTTSTNDTTDATD